MPWSKSVLPKELAENTVLSYVPNQIQLGTPQQALNYLMEKQKGSDFRMSDPMRIQTGIAEIEEADSLEKIDEAALQKLQEIQEAAYKEAYELGLEEGKATAFQHLTNDIQNRLEEVDKLLQSFSEMKKELLAQNEAHLVKLLFHMASRIAHKEIQEDSMTVVNTLRDAVALAQDEQNILVRVAQEQFDFFESLKKQTGREFDFLRKIRFEPAAEVTIGGCIVETNFGEVDARTEQRISTLWNVISENTPKVKDKIAI